MSCYCDYFLTKNVVQVQPFLLGNKTSLAISNALGEVSIRARNLVRTNLNDSFRSGLWSPDHLWRMLNQSRMIRNLKGFDNATFVMGLLWYDIIFFYSTWSHLRYDVIPRLDTLLGWKKHLGKGQLFLRARLPLNSRNTGGVLSIQCCLRISP